MLHGKKGFDRIVWAFKNALNQSLSWLFVDLEHPNVNSGSSRSVKAGGDAQKLR